MEDKKPIVLDVLRLIVAILTAVASLFVAIVFVLALKELLNDTEDGFSGLIFLVMAPIIVGAVVYFVTGIKWIRKYFKTKNTPLVQRKTNASIEIVKVVLAMFFLSYYCVPLVVYWGLNIIEAVRKSNLIKKIKAQNSEPKYITNETHPIDEPNKCKYCGADVDERYARFCQHCGAEIEYRK
ncbi:MAG: zinc ribbon domain-containing protein [Clostridia bacterium]|nr:zinc ribbon domain-containing protein [Clostridia bacterium]